MAISLKIVGDRDLSEIDFSLTWVDHDQGVCCSRSRLVEMTDFLTF